MNVNVFVWAFASFLGAPHPYQSLGFACFGLGIPVGVSWYLIALICSSLFGVTKLDGFIRLLFMSVHVFWLFSYHSLPHYRVIINTFYTTFWFHLLVCCRIELSLSWEVTSDYIICLVKWNINRRGILTHENLNCPEHSSPQTVCSW